MNQLFKSSALAILLLCSQSAVFGSDDKVGVIAQSPSTDGSQVVFSADFDRSARLWAAAIDGSGLRKISRTVAAQDAVTELEPALSSDGRLIAYVSVTASKSNIWLVQADGSFAGALTTDGGSQSPAWSPDGTKIAFISDRSGTNDVWIMNADGSGQRRVTTLPGQENRPSFSPDGNKLVFSYTNSGTATLWVVNTDSSNLAPVTTGAFSDYEPNWGPQGIIFSTDRNSPSGRWRIWAVQPDGSNLRPLGDVPGHDPVWLPNGDLLFTEEKSALAISTISRLRAATVSRELVVDVQGFIHPIDIRPRKAINKINPVSQGKVEVAILSTLEFDAATAVDRATITFGSTGSEQTLAFCDKNLRDVSGDGRPDLTCRFATRAGQFKQSSTEGVLRFKTTDGVPFEGRNPITIVSDEDPDDLK
jgi:dipeptidyl aminopeptidase/acylaminoacyl peptidase